MGRLALFTSHEGPDFVGGSACVIVSLATYCFSSNVQLVTVAAVRSLKPFYAFSDVTIYLFEDQPHHCEQLSDSTSPNITTNLIRFQRVSFSV